MRNIGGEEGWVLLSMEVKWIRILGKLKGGKGGLSRVLVGEKYRRMNREWVIS